MKRMQGLARDDCVGQSKRWVVGGLIIVVLSIGFMSLFAHSAFASGATDGVATTSIYLKADNTKIVASAPTRIDVAVAGDGSFTTPSAASTLISNGSIFSIRVSNIEVSMSDPFQAVAGTDFETTKLPGAIKFAITPGSGNSFDFANAAKPGGVAVNDSSWNMPVNGNLALSTAGALKNNTADISASKQFADIRWTFAAGTY